MSAPPRPRLDAVELIASARGQTGLDDLDDDGLAGRLAILAGWLARRLDDDGRARAAAVAHGLLVQRLEFFAARRQYPLAGERIEAPLITFGEARSGTTALQMLLGRHADNRLLEFWEVMYPGPPPGCSDTATRRRRADEDWREILRLVPKWLVSHPYNAMLGKNPPECERLWAMDLRTAPPTAWWRVPAVPLAPPPLRLPQDPVRQYQIHTMFLQYLQYGAPSRRWVLKGISHQHRLAALLAAYPDATFAWIHRDPLTAIASRFELHAQVFEGIAGSVDRAAFARATVDTCVRNFLAAAENPLAADPRIHHLLYQDFIADPVAAVRELYDRGGLAYPEAFERAMRAWLAENPPGQFGKFTYSQDALGVDVDQLDRALDPYRERFAVPRERRKG
jgi:hypothetical protein